MMVKALAPIAELFELGVLPGTSQYDAQRIRLLNAISFSGLLVTSINLFLFMFFSLWPFLYINLLGMTCFLAAIGLNSFGHFKSALFLTGLTIPPFFATLSLVVGEGYGYEYALVVTSLPPLVLYKKTRNVLFFMSESVGLFGLAKYLHSSVVPWTSMPFKDQVYDLNIFVALGVILFIVSYYRFEVLKYQKLLIQSNNDIKASINYAQRIQKAILPEVQNVRSGFEEAFVLFQPRDIVSGDFYWYNETDRCLVIAAADCTGHGVPGAFMSMIGNDLLNGIVIEGGITSPAEILSRLHLGIRKALRQADSDAQDGMDIALCVIDKEQETLRFSGAKNPLVYIENGLLTQIKGDKHAIGGDQRGKKREYVEHCISIIGQKTFYIFTDGYQDQFGGEKKKKYMVKRLKQLLTSIQSQPLDMQQEILERDIAQWMEDGGENQVDDILVIGFKPKQYHGLRP